MARKPNQSGQTSNTLMTDKVKRAAKEAAEPFKDQVAEAFAGEVRDFFSSGELFDRALQLLNPFFEEFSASPVVLADGGSGSSALLAGGDYSSSTIDTSSTPLYDGED